MQHHIYRVTFIRCPNVLPSDMNYLDDISNLLSNIEMAAIYIYIYIHKVHTYTYIYIYVIEITEVNHWL